MTLKQWAANGWLREHRTSPEEISGLLSIVEHDPMLAGTEIPEWDALAPTQITLYTSASVIRIKAG